MKIRALIGVITFAAMIICAVVTYNIISGTYSPETGLVMAPGLPEAPKQAATAEQAATTSQAETTEQAKTAMQTETAEQAETTEQATTAVQIATTEQNTATEVSATTEQNTATEVSATTEQAETTAQPIQSEPSTQPSQAGQTETEGTQAADNELQAAPDFAMEDWSGAATTLSELIANGKPIVLNFWASWCPPCKGEMPEFEKVFLELGDDIQFIMLDVTDGQRETRAIGEQYILEQGYTFPVFFDSYQEASLAYGIRYIPTTIFIDSDGYMVAGAQSAIDERTLRQGIGMISADHGVQ